VCPVPSAATPVDSSRGVSVCRAGFAGRGTAVARRPGASHSRPVRPETRVSGRTQTGVIRAQPRDRRGLALRDEAQYLARLEVVVELLDDRRDRARGARVGRIAREDARELLLVRDALGAVAIEGG